MAATEWVKVRRKKGGEILPNKVPRSHLKYAEHLEEVPSSRAKAAAPTGGVKSQEAGKK